MSDFTEREKRIALSGIAFGAAYQEWRWHGQSAGASIAQFVVCAVLSCLLSALVVRLARLAIRRIDGDARP